MLNGYIPYDTISRGVWPHRGPCLLRFFFSRLPEALRGLMTKQTFRACSPSIAFIKNSLNYIKTSNNRLSEKRTNHLSPIDFTNIRIKPSEKRTPHYTPVIGH